MHAAADGTRSVRRSAKREDRKDAVVTRILCHSDLRGVLGIVKVIWISLLVQVSQVNLPWGLQTAPRAEKSSKHGYLPSERPFGRHITAYDDIHVTSKKWPNSLDILHQKWLYSIQSRVPKIVVQSFIPKTAIQPMVLIQNVKRPNSLRCLERLTRV